MPLEQDKQDFMPEDFNLLWPLARDLISRGDDHLRLIKKAAANLQTFTDTELTLLKSYFDLTHNPVAAKLALKALEADAITGVQFDKFALKDGTYDKLRARATTAEDVGLGAVENYGVASTLTDSDELYVRASLLTYLYAQLQEEIRKRQPPDFSQFARKTGTYQHLRAMATTKEDVGLKNIENYPLSQVLEDDDQKYGSARSVYLAHADVLRKVTAGASSVAEASGVDSDNKSFLISANGVEYTFRTLTITSPFDKMIWRLPAMRIAMNSASASGVVRLEVWLEDNFGSISTTHSVEVPFTGNERVGHTLTTFSLVGVSTEVSGRHNVQIKCKATLVSGSNSWSGSLTYGDGAGNQNGVIQFSAPSRILKIS